MDPRTGAVGRDCLRVAARGNRGKSVAAAARETDAVVVTVGSTGVDALEPLVLATVDGTTAFLPRVSPDRAREAAEAVADGRLPTTEDRDGHGPLSDRRPSADGWTVDHDPETPTLPIPRAGALAVGRRRVLGPLGWVDPVAPGDVELVSETDVDPLATAERVGLLGRGRGDGRTDEPVAEGWRTARDAEGDPVVVVNANEADDRVAADRLLLEGAPIHVLDGASAVADAVGAGTVVVYCNEADRIAADRVRRAAEALGDALPVEVQVAGGPDRYVAGEETMALESLEGNDRLEARLRPPRVEAHGLYGRPTVVHTPRTLAQVRALLADPGAFAADDVDPGTRVVTVSGAVDAPASVELGTGTSLARVLDAVTVTDGVAFACVGGRFGGITRSLDVSAGAPALTAADLDTNGAVELFTEETCVVAEVGDRTAGAAADNCGRCVPCREGSQQLRSLLRELYEGAFDDIGIRELTRTMRASSTCAFGRDAARTVATALAAFETEFRAHADGRCPAGVCPGMEKS